MWRPLRAVKRIAVAGLGLVGVRHAAAVTHSGHAELAAVIDPEVTRRRAWDVPGYADISDVDLPLDGIILATPSHIHAEQAVYCLDRGWPCLIEKPIDVSLTAADRIVSVSEVTGIPVLIGHHRRHHASVRSLRDRLAHGQVGQPVLATLIWAVRKPDSYFEGTWRSGSNGSPVMINCVHDIDLLRFLFGEITEIAAMGAVPIRQVSERVESGVIALRFQSGVLASIAFADTSPSPWGFESGTRENPNIAGTGQDCLWIAGTRGGVAFPSLTLWGGATDWGDAPLPQRVPSEPSVPLEAQLSHFLDVIDGAPPLCRATDGRATLEATLEVARLVQASCVSPQPPLHSVW